jgi:hypothetical protein
VAPRLVTFPGQSAQISMTTPITYSGLETAVDAHERPKPVTKTIEEGLRLDACAQRAADGGVTFGFRLKVTKVKQPIEDLAVTLASGPPVTIQTPETSGAEASGTRWLEPGVQGLLARVSSPDGSGPLLVLARVTPIRIDGPEPGAAPENFGDGGLARPMSGHTLHLRVSAVTIGREIEPGTILDETAAPDVLKAAGGSKLRDFEIFSCLDSRVRLAGLLETQGGARGLVAQGRDDGKLDISWTTTSGTRRATIRPNAGRRFVALANVEGGGTAGVIVSVDAD